MRLGEALSKPSQTKQSVAAATIHEGQILTGPLFSEPMLVETVRSDGPGTWIAGLVGQQSERFRRVTLTADDIASLTIADSQLSYDGDGRLLRLGLQAYSLGIAYEFEPYFGLSISRVDPLPHQLEAVYEHLLKLPRVRFLLADDAGAGKTIMAGLLIRELKLRGLIERTLVACPANLAFQWQRELNEKFDERFVVLKGGDIRDQFGVNQWLEQRQIITSLDLAKRTDILPGLAQVRWDLVIVDEAHRMSARDEAHKSQRYRLGELLRDSADHVLLLTATPHKGDPQNFTLFLQLLDQDAYADVKSIREAMEHRRAPFYLRRTKEAMVYFPERQARRSVDRQTGVHETHPAHRRLRHRRRRVRALPGGDALRETAEPPRRRRRRRPAGPRGRIPYGAVPAAPGFQHPRHAALPRKPGTAPGRRDSSAPTTCCGRPHRTSPTRTSSTSWRKPNASGWSGSWRRTRWPGTPIRSARRSPSSESLPRKRRRSKAPAARPS